MGKPRYRQDELFGNIRLPKTPKPRRPKEVSGTRPTRKEEDRIRSATASGLVVRHKK